MQSHIFVLTALVTTASAQADDWRELEAPLLTDHVQLTSADQFVKAGEAYFSPNADWIIFQAVPIPPEGEQPDIHYSMYVAKLLKDDAGRVTGLGESHLVSAPGSANTCGWFHPRYPGHIMFGSTITEPVQDEKPGFQVGTNKYVWQFPESMEIVTRIVPQMLQFEGVAVDYTQDSLTASPIFSRPGYDAEGSWSSGGRFILYANVNPENESPEPDADIYIYDTETNQHTTIVEAAGYDGGPFFNADDSLICYRSDRAGDDRLQLYISELEYIKGQPVGAKREIKLTDNDHVNWAPYFHPDSASLIYTTSHVGHFNYEVFGIDAALERAPGKPLAPRSRTQRRVTFAEGFDGLSVFSPDARMMMWTSQRMPEGEPGKGASQLWIARIPDGVTGADFAGPLSEDQALILATRAAAEDGAQTDSPQADLRGGSWLVTFPQSFGPARSWRIAPDSSATAMTGGD